jgi:hypothetical protein
VDWICLAQDGVQWQAYVEIAMKFLGSAKGGIFLNELSDCHLINKHS